MVIVRAATQRRERWRNGGGWTSTIACGRVDDLTVAGSDDWDWRLSIADIEADGPFSVFPGIDRVLVLLDGGGIELAFADGERACLRQTLAQIAFAGEDKVHCALIAGPTRDFNLMWRRQRLCADLRVASLAEAAAALAAPAALQALHVLSGALHLGGAVATAGDTVLVTGSAPLDLAVAAGGQALSVRGERR
jgi:environmental stress-induced protein Ves